MSVARRCRRPYSELPGSVIARSSRGLSLGDAGGWTDIRLPSVSDRGLIEARVKILLAGRAANGVFGSPADTGATADLSEATRLLAAAKLSFGLTDSLVFRAGPDQALDMVARDRSLADAIGQELARLMISTKRVVAENRDVIERVVKASTRPNGPT